jgi:hypothetical protein
VPCELLVGNEWIVVDGSPADLQHSVADAAEIGVDMAPMASWTRYDLPDGRVMRIAQSAINGIRWIDSEDT